MAPTKKRREVEIYENYWNFTAAHLNILGTKFNNCLNVILMFIDRNRKELEANAEAHMDFTKSDRRSHNFVHSK